LDLPVAADLDLPAGVWPGMEMAASETSTTAAPNIHTLFTATFFTLQRIASRHEMVNAPVIVD
jgi:hypothetical protein